jgi:Tfp pilus assembly protein FimT
VVLATAVYAMPWVARERARSALYELQSYMQLTRIEAVSRNHDCRFVVDTATRTLQIYDSNGTGATGDDILLHETTLPPVIVFDRPDSGLAITLSQIGTSSTYETVFTSDGVVASGTGTVAVYGGEEFNRIQVQGAGGVMVEHWDGSSWVNL